MDPESRSARERVAPFVASRSTGPVVRQGLLFLALGFVWWSVYRDASASRRRTLKVLFGGAYGLMAVGLLALGDWLLSAGGVVLGAGTVYVMRLADRDIANRDRDEDIRRAARRERYRREAASAPFGRT